MMRELRISLIVILCVVLCLIGDVSSEYYCFETLNTAQGVCSGHGTCVDTNTCECDLSYGGQECSYDQPHRVLGYGENSYHALGVGDTSSTVPSPVQVSINSNTVLDISSSDEFTVFLTNDGLVYGSGYSRFGRLCREEETVHPVERIDLTNIKSIATGWEQSFFVDGQGNAYACGQNTDKSLGLVTNNITVAISPENVQLENVQKVVSGKAHSIFLTSTDAVYVSGRSAYGALCQGPNIIQEDIPTSIYVGKPVADVAVGATHSLFLLNNRSVLVCGAEEAHGLSTDSDVFYPSRIPLQEDVLAISANLQATYLLTTSGALYGFGVLQTFGTQATPLEVSLGPFVALSAGEAHVMLLDADDRIHCVGENDMKQCMDDSASHFTSPVDTGIHSVKLPQLSMGSSASFFYENMCENGRYGANCDEYSCFGLNWLSSLVCNGHGSCASVDTCDCVNGFAGSNCSVQCMDPGEYVIPSTSTCETCPIGKACFGNNSISSCQPPQYASSTGSSDCDDCPSGFYVQTNGNGDGVDCRPCSAGYACETPATRTACNNSREYSTGQSTICDTCSFSSILIQDASGRGIDCVSCDPGQFKNQSLACEDCPPGFSCSGGLETIACQGSNYSIGGQSKCSNCPSGSLVEKNSGNHSIQCSECPSGYACPGNGEKQACTLPEYSQSGQKACHICPEGSHVINGTACVECEAGYYCTSGKRYACPSGTNQYSQQNSSGCATCPEGSFVSETNGVPTGCNVCLQDAMCPGDGRHYTCSNGHYFDIFSSACNICPSGSYCPGDAQKYPCTGSMYASQSGHDSCSVCGNGFYVETNNAGEGIGCIACEAGYACGRDGKKHECNGTTEYSQSTSASCSTCAKTGKYVFQNEKGLHVNCSVCEEAGYCPGDGSMQLCNGGHFRQNTSCSICPQGYYCEGGLNPNKIPCTGKQAYTTEGQESCSQCQLGSVLIRDSAGHGVGCETCPLNYACNGTIIKTQCNPPMYSNEGASQCEQCRKGSYLRNLHGIIECTSCTLGRACPDGINFRLCEAPLYSNDTGLSSCLLCSPGKHVVLSADGAAIGCNKCPDGEWSSDMTTCNACPANYACASGTKTNCMESPRYPLSSESGQSSCGFCGQGKYITSDAECLACSDGYYCPGDGNQYECSTSDLQSCNGHGTCDGNGSCICDDGYDSELCANITCFGIEAGNASVCSSHGTCAGPNHCICDEYAGDNCQYSLPEIDVSKMKFAPEIGRCGNMVIDAREAYHTDTNHSLSVRWHSPRWNQIHYKQKDAIRFTRHIYKLEKPIIEIPQEVLPGFGEIKLLFTVYNNTLGASQKLISFEHSDEIFPVAETAQSMTVSSSAFIVEGLINTPGPDCDGLINSSMVSYRWSLRDEVPFSLEEIVDVNSLNTPNLVVNRFPAIATQFELSFSVLYGDRISSSVTRIESIPRKTRVSIAPYPRQIHMDSRLCLSANIDDVYDRDIHLRWKMWNRNFNMLVSTSSYVNMTLDEFIRGGVPRGANDFYFTVTPYHEDTPTGDGTTIPITFLNHPAASVMISRVGSSFDNDQRQVYQANFFSSTPMEDVQFKWKVSSSKWEDEFVPLSESGLGIRSPPNASFVVFESQQFELGHSYTLMVSVNDKNNTLLDSHELSITSDTQSNGQLDISPKEGYAMETEFVASTSRWTSDSSLEYEFRYYDAVREREVTMRPFSSSDSFKFFLPSLSIGSNSSVVEMRVYARDDHNRLFRTSSSVKVHSREQGYNLDNLHMLTQKIGSISQKMTWLSSVALQIGESRLSNTSLIRTNIIEQLKNSAPVATLIYEDQLQIFEILSGATSNPDEISEESFTSSIDIVSNQIERKRELGEYFTEKSRDMILSTCSNLVATSASRNLAENLRTVSNVTDQLARDLYNTQYPGEDASIVMSENLRIGAMRSKEWKEQTLSDSTRESSRSISISIPKEVFGEQRAGIRFKSLTDSSAYAKQANVSSNVLSLDVFRDDEKYSPNSFETPIRFTLHREFDLSIVEENDHRDGIRPVCSYWDAANETWVSDGMRLVSYSNTSITCETNHTTDFSVLMNFIPAPNFLDANVITGKDSIIHLNEDNFTTTIVVFAVWILYLTSMMGLEGWYTCSWFVRQKQAAKKEKTMKIGAVIDGRRRYVEPIYQKFRDLHLWLSVFLLPSVENQNSTRSQRLTLLMILFLGICLSNAMSIGIDDEVQYWITCVMADFIVAPFIAIPWFLFSKLKPRNIPVDPSVEEKVQKEKESQKESDNSIKEDKVLSDVALSCRTDSSLNEQSSTMMKIRLKLAENRRSIEENRKQLTARLDKLIDSAVQLFSKFDVRITGFACLLFGSMIYFALIAAGSYVILFIEWLGPIGTSILIVGAISAYISIICELYLHSKLRAFKKGKVSWISRWTIVNVILSISGCISVLIGGATAIIVIASQSEEAIDSNLKLGISVVIGVFMFAIISITFNWLYRNLRTPSLHKKNKRESRLKSALKAKWFPWWFKGPIYALCWGMMIFASWFLIMYGIKFSRMGIEGDFFFAITCGNSQNAFLDNPSGIILSTIVTAILLKLFQTLFFPKDQIIGSNPVGQDEDEEEIEENESFNDLPTMHRQRMQGLTTQQELNEIESARA